jgi:hypothetical protein
VQIQITYTHPPSADAARAAGQIRTINEAAEELPELRAALAAAEGEEAAAYKSEIAAIEELLATLPELEEIARVRAQLRVNVRSCAYLDKGHYWRLITEGREWFKAQTGQAIEDAAAQDDGLLLANLIYYRAEILASIERDRTPAGYHYKAQTRSAETAPWTPGYLPDAWATLEGMGEAMPADLLAELLEATRELNAGILPTAGDFLAGPRVEVTRIG